METDNIEKNNKGKIIQKTNLIMTQNNNTELFDCDTGKDCVHYNHENDLFLTELSFIWLKGKKRV